MARGQRFRGSFNYNNIEKKDKNFMYQNLKRSNCYNCNFAGSNFDFASFRGAHFKTCSFMKCTFTGAEFVGSNLKNTKFKDALLENTVFDAVNLDGTDFQEAQFKNTIFLNTDFELARNVDFQDPELRIFDKMPEIEVSDNLRNTIKDIEENEFIKKARVFDTKEGDLNLLTVMILLENFEEDRLIRGLNAVKAEIDRDFHTLSYIIRLIQKVE